MPAKVITVTVQLGSGGFAVARSVADKLGFRYYDWEITSEAAARAGVSPQTVLDAERVPGFIERMLRSLGTASAVTGGEIPFIGPTPATMTTAVQTFNSQYYREFITLVIKELAAKGDAVIVGHAAQLTLRGTPGVLRVLVHGSLEARARRLATESQSSVEEARAIVKESDHERGESFKQNYKVDWLSATLYDLALNTDGLSLDSAAEIIIAAARSLN